MIKLIDTLMPIYRLKRRQAVLPCALLIALSSPSGIALATPGSGGEMSQMKPLGRLFFSPAERRLREHQWMSRPQPQAETENKQAAISPPVDLLISGRLRRSDGYTTTWIGGAPYEDISQAQFWSDSDYPGKISIRLRPFAPTQDAWVGGKTLFPHYFMKEIEQNK